MRCSHCGHRWTQNGATAEEPSAPEAEPVPAAEAQADGVPERESAGDAEAPSPTDPPPPREPADLPREPEQAAEETPDGDEPSRRPEAEAPSDKPAVDPEPIPAALRKGKSPIERWRQDQKKKPSVAMLAGIGALAALIVIMFVLLVARGPIVSAVPGAAGFYRGVGLMGDEPGAGLEIRDVRSARQRDGPDEILTIEGVVANVTDEPLELPVIRVSLSDADGEELQFVTVPPETPSLPPGETAAFEARIVNPSAIVRRVKVKFTPTDDGSSDETRGGEP